MHLRVVALVVALAAAHGLSTNALPASVRQPRKVRLRIQPRLGDTLRMQFEQVVQAAGPERAGEAAVTRASAMRVASRSIVQQVDATGTTVLTITDSAVFDAPGADPRAVDAARRAMKGRRARMHVSPAGAMEMLDAPQAWRGDAAADLGADPSLARLPGTLPESPVSVGATWTREMTLPSGVGALGAGGKLEVVFRLDSLGGGGTLAYVSMRGALSRTGVAQGGAHVSTSGTMTGRLLVDLRRGWMTDSHATFAMVSSLAASIAGGKPQQLRLTVTQRLHCVGP